MTATIPTDKPFQIDKKRVYEAYKAVRSNRGAAGVDGQSLEQFDQDVKGNLYKIWNRMASGRRYVRCARSPMLGLAGPTLRRAPPS